MELSDTFLLFCENTEIMILDSQSVQYGVKYKVSRRGEEAFMTLYDNGNSLPQGPWNSSLLKLLQVWSCTNPAQRQMTEEETRMFSGGGMPAFYLSWREWKEDAGSLKNISKSMASQAKIKPLKDTRFVVRLCFTTICSKKQQN